MGKRYCWVRRAELALAQGELEQAQDIIDRLIITAPGIEPGDVITYLWMLKGRVFKRLGRIEESINLLETSAANAQRTGEKFLLWRAHANLGQLYLAKGSSDAAEKEFLASGTIVDEIAATILDETIRENFLRYAHITLAYYK